MKRKLNDANSKPTEEVERKPKKLNTKVAKDSWLETMSDYFLNFLTKGNLEEQTSNFQVSFNKILSENHVKQVFHILRMPTMVEVGYLEKIRTDLLESLPIDLVPDVDIQIHEFLTRNYMMVDDKKASKIKGSVGSSYQRQLEKVRLIKEYLSSSNDGRITERDLSLAVDNLKLLERKKLSFENVIKHKSKGGEYLVTYTFLELTAKNKEILNIAVDKLTSILQVGYNDEPFEFQVITNNVLEYLKEYGLASYYKQGKKGMKLPQIDLPTSVMACDEQYSTGIVRSTNPRVCLGNLVENNYPFHIDMTETDDAYNIMLLADTGSGKTKAMMYFFLSVMLDQRSNCIVDDLKGLEWTPFAKIFNKHAIVSLNILNPTFVNTLKIPDWKRFNFSSPKAAYLLAYNSTLRILGSLCACKPEDQPIINNILGDLVDFIYLNNRIDIQEPSTYHLSQNFHFADTVISMWDRLINLNNMKDKYESVHVDLVNETLYKYFSRRGAKRFLFETEVDVESLMDKKFIVFDHGRDIAGGNGTKSQEEIMCGMVQKNYVSNLYTALNFMRGEYTYELIEEVVRQLNDPFVTGYLVDELVGKRSSNKRNILAFNSLDVLLNPKVNADDIGKIREQIGIYLVGRCNNATAEQLIRHIGRPEISETLMKVTSQSHLDTRYIHSFAYINYHCGTVRGIRAYKCPIPKAILETYMKPQILMK